MPSTGADATTKTGTIKITSEPDGADVNVDGAFMGWIVRRVREPGDQISSKASRGRENEWS